MSFKSIALLVIGTGFLVAAALSAWRTSQFVAASESVAGRVVALNAGGSHPEIRFVTRTGITVDYPQGGLIGGYAVGDAVQVRYLPAEPKTSASIDTFGALWLVPLVLTFFAACFVIGALQSRTSNTLVGTRFG